MGGRLPAAVANGGGLGVTLFFVLSGFLISGLLFDEFRRTGTVDTRRFLIRRGLKLYPPLWALIVFYVLLNVVRGLEPWHDCAPRALAEMFFVQNYFPGIHGHTWTLAVEEHFYIACAALVAGLIAGQVRSPFRGIPLVWVAVGVGCALLRMRLAASGGNLEWAASVHLPGDKSRRLRLHSAIRSVQRGHERGCSHKLCGDSRPSAALPRRGGGTGETPVTAASGMSHFHGACACLRASSAGSSTCTAT